MKEFKHNSKKQMILDHLKKGDSITPLEALNKYGSFRLSAVIFNIKELGYETHTEMMHDMETPYARYTIPKFVKRKELEELTGQEWGMSNFLINSKTHKVVGEISDENIDNIISLVGMEVVYCTPF